MRNKNEKNIISDTEKYLKKRAQKLTRTSYKH